MGFSIGLSNRMCPQMPKSNDGTGIIGEGTIIFALVSGWMRGHGSGTIIKTGVKVLTVFSL